MGFVNDTHMSQFIPAVQVQKSAGTWTATLASNVLADVRTAADAGFNLFVPVRIPGNSSALKGAKLKSVELLYKVTTAALDGVATVELEKCSVSAGGAVTGAAVTVTVNAAEDTTAKRLAVADHRLVATLSAPEWVDNDCYYVLYVAFDAAATSVVTLYGAIANFELRV